MTDFFKDILNSLLCAARKNYSCQSLLIKIIEDWKLALDKHESVGVILMDLSKAFDCLPYDLLLCKLKSFVKILKSRGPRVLPWGTPLKIFVH